MSKVSIILPVYNCEKYLAPAIESVLAQTYQNWELLVSDNCSQDSSADIAKKYAKQDKRIIVSQNDKNIGLYQNYNKCIQQSTGEYIELFGADDIFEPNCLAHLVQVLEVNPHVALATSARKLIDGQGQYIGTVNPFVENKLMSAREFAQSTIGTLSNWIVSPVMFRAIYKGNGFDLNLKLSADLEYWLKVLQHGNLFYLNEVLFNYRVHTGSETNRIFADFSFVLDVLHLADRYAKDVIGTDSSNEEFKNMVVDRLLTLTNYAKNQLNMSYDSLLSPQPEQSPLNIPLTDCLRELHDYKRIAYMTLSYCTSPDHELQKLKDERDSLIAQLNKALRENDALNNCIDEQTKEISSILNSQSWKFTAPLRKMSKKLFKNTNTDHSIN